MYCVKPPIWSSLWQRTRNLVTHTRPPRRLVDNVLYRTYPFKWHRQKQICIIWHIEIIVKIVFLNWKLLISECTLMILRTFAIEVTIQFKVRLKTIYWCVRKQIIVLSNHSQSIIINKVNVLYLLMYFKVCTLEHVYKIRAAEHDRLTLHKMATYWQIRPIWCTYAIRVNN